MLRSAQGSFTPLGAAASILAALALLIILVYGKSFLVPLVIALMLAGVISAAAVRLEAIGFPTWLAMACAIGAGFAVPLLVVAIFYGQMDAVADAWPKPAFPRRTTELLPALADSDVGFSSLSHWIEGNHGAPNG